MTIELSEYVINAIADAVVKKMQQPCEDAVSRQAVKDILDARGVKAVMTFEHFKELLDKLPPVTPQPKWIPVSERLPEKDGQYLVTVKKGYMLIGLWCGIKEDWGNVIAWMPLPQPYRAESEDEEGDRQ